MSREVHSAVVSLNATRGVGGWTGCVVDDIDDDFSFGLNTDTFAYDGIAPTLEARMRWTGSNRKATTVVTLQPQHIVVWYRGWVIAMIGPQGGPISDDPITGKPLVAKLQHALALSLAKEQDRA